MTFKVQKITRPDGQRCVRIELIMPVPPPQLVHDDGTVLLRQYLTEEQWIQFKRVDAEDIEIEIWS